MPLVGKTVTISRLVGRTVNIIIDKSWSRISTVSDYIRYIIVTTVEKKYFSNFQVPQKLSLVFGMSTRVEKCKPKSSSFVTNIIDAAKALNRM